MNRFDSFFDACSKDGICAVGRSSYKFDVVKEAGERYFCFPFWNICAERASYWLFVRKSALPEKGEVRLKVDEDMIGRVIGTGGRNIKKVSKMLKRHIIVEAV